MTPIFKLKEELRPFKPIELPTYTFIAKRYNRRLEGKKKPSRAIVEQLNTSRLPNKVKAINIEESELSLGLQEHYSWNVKSEKSKNIDNRIKEGLQFYYGPKFIITSALRNWPKKSLHRHGKAIDIHYDEDVVDYLISDRGENWLKENHLEFFIEDNHSILGKLKERFHKFFRVVGHASGKHIHINLVD